MVHLVSYIVNKIFVYGSLSLKVRVTDVCIIEMDILNSTHIYVRVRNEVKAVWSEVSEEEVQEV